MKYITLLFVILSVLLPSNAFASVDVLAAGWWNASLDELISARNQIDNQILSLKGQLPSTITPTPIPLPTSTPVIQYVYLTPSPTVVLSSSPINAYTVEMPNVKGLSENEAKSILNGMGIHVKTRKEYSNDGVKRGYVLFQDTPAGTPMKQNSIVTLNISKGPIMIQSEQSTWYAWWVKGSNGDDYDFVDGSPYIYEDTLYISLKATMNSKYKHLWRGYGTAAINDTFDKVVPITVGYEQEEMKKGETQKITLVIPLQNLDVDRPTTISTKLEMYYGNKKNEESVRIDFTFSWPSD